MELLTDDVLADVLRRLPPRSLAVSRCVCRAWRALIDGDGMLRADLLPRSLAGFIICYHDHQELPRAMLFARPGVGSDDYDIPGGPLDHCNGLLLFYRDVLNPATGRYATLPERVATDRNHLVLEYEFLAFDPAVSSHYEVVMVPYVVPPKPRVVGEPAIGSGGGAMLDSEWPPSPWVFTVFSSATGLWEKKLFIRQGEPAGTVADLRPNWWINWRDDGRAEYWRGTLYVHCKTNYVMRYIYIYFRFYFQLPLPIHIYT
jgi:hypothetical protein